MAGLDEGSWQSKRDGKEASVKGANSESKGLHFLQLLASLQHAADCRRSSNVETNSCHNMREENRRTPQRPAVMG